MVGERLIYELRGVACMDLEAVAPTRKGCAVTRSFSSRVRTLDQVERAVATYAARLGEKLRRANLGTDHVTVFLHTSEHDHGAPQRSAYDGRSPGSIFRYRHADKGGPMGRAPYLARRLCLFESRLITDDLVPLAISQRALPGIGQFDRAQSGALMSALDICNSRWGRGTVVLAAAGFAKTRSWSTKFEMRSSRYTTRVDEMMVVSA